MASLNKVILIGNLGADPEVRYTSGGQPVANLRLATTEKFRNRDGDITEKTEWHRVVVWGKQAESCKQYLHRGRQVYIEGTLETRQWTDKEGASKQTTEVRALRVLFLGGREAGQPGKPEPESHGPPGGAAAGAPPVAPPSSPPADDGGYFPEPPPGGISEDDIPF